VLSCKFNYLKYQRIDTCNVIMQVQFPEIGNNHRLECHHASLISGNWELLSPWLLSWKFKFSKFGITKCYHASLISRKSKELLKMSVAMLALFFLFLLFLKNWWKQCRPAKWILREKLSDWINCCIQIDFFWIKSVELWYMCSFRWTLVQLINRDGNFLKFF